jgi:hypothetical protein
MSLESNAYLITVIYGEANVNIYYKSPNRAYAIYPVTKIFITPPNIDFYFLSLLK